LRGEVGGFPFGALLMLVLGFAARTEAASAISGLLPLSAGLRGEVGGFPFEALLTLVLGFAVRPEAAFAISGLLPGPRSEVGGFPFGALLMPVLGFAVRTEVAFAVSGLLLLRFALNMAVGRRLDLVLLGFLAIGSPVEVVVKSCPQKRSDAGEHRCAIALAEREGRPL
jgi:hypothetical protein